MYREHRPQDRLFLTYARTFSLAGARARAEADPELRKHFDLEAIFAEVSEMRALPAEAFASRYRAVAPTVSAPVRSYFLHFYLHHRQAALGLADLDPIQEEVGAQPGDARLDPVLLDCLRGHLRVLDGHVGSAITLLAGQPVHVLAENGSLYGRYLEALVYRNLGLATQRAGDFEGAQRHLTRALALAQAHDFLLVLSCNAHLATLLWASGQYRHALALHKDPALRELARASGNHNQLLHSHVSAAKCAIDLKSTDQAQHEIDAARQLLLQTSDAWPAIEAYVRLYSGELAVQRERFEEGLDLLEDALQRFESLDPPHYPGALDAKIALTHFALYEKDYRTAFALLRKLLLEAEHHGCLEARSRLLVLEAYLYVTDNPPLRAAYDDLVARVHLINNPALLFRALGNLYTYALEHLDEAEQLFLLERIRNLKPLLSGSCYDDLYRRYISERYEYAVENRLARYVEADWVSWDADPPPPCSPGTASSGHESPGHESPGHESPGHESAGPESAGPESKGPASSGPAPSGPAMP